MKDVIYIDIEDDITSIIEKVKSAKVKIVALVPPKRTGVLQSVVNLKLLQKAAQADDKRLVLITGEQSLASLAAGVKIPVAKNLQSKPELATITALEVDDEDVINGEELSVGELDTAAKPAPTGMASATATSAFDALQKDKKPSQPGMKDQPTKKNRIPNFDSFRKRLFIGIGAGVFLIGFLVWALAWAPQASVAITAKTTAVAVDIPLKLDVEAQTQADKNIVRPLAEELKKTQTVDFAATGSKDVGEKATGSMTLVNSASSDAIVVAAGTRFTASNGLQFTSNANTTIPGARIEGGKIVGGQAATAVTASDIGENYNLPAQSYTSSNTSVSANGSAMAGGSKRTVKIISQDDVTQARQKLKEQDDTAVKAELKQKFKQDVMVLEESYTVTPGEPAVAPAVEQEATAGKMSVETTYTLLAVQQSDVKALLKYSLDKELEGKTGQQIYNDGVKSVAFSKFTRQDGALTVNLTTTAHTGPKIDESALKKQLAGKRYGEIQQQVEAISGVENVETTFWPFWVTAAPGPEKITIKFVIKSDEQ